VSRECDVDAFAASERRRTKAIDELTDIKGTTAILDFRFGRGKPRGRATQWLKPNDRSRHKGGLRCLNPNSRI